MAEVQLQLLKKYLFVNRETLFGKKHAFKRIDNYREYRKAVPIIEDFEVLTHYIQSIAEGEKQVLTNEKVLFFESTSGSCAAAKWIPYTATLKTEFQNAVAVWMRETAIAFPKAFRGTSYWSISPPLKKREKTIGGLQVGLDSDLGYFHPLIGKLLTYGFAVKKEIIAEDAHSFYMQLCRELLAGEKLSFISVWSPGYFLQLHDFMEQHLDKILNTVKIAPDRRKNLAAMNGFSWKSAFPELALLSCWTDAQSEIWLPEVTRHLGNVPVQSKGLLLTEGVVSVPWRDGSHGLAYTSHFFEFRELESRQVFLAGQLEQGLSYEVIITTGGGLYRYNTRDLVEITAMDLGVPIIKFLGKGSDYSDLVGEKIPASYLFPLFRQIGEESFGKIRSLFLYPTIVDNKVLYQVLVESEEHLDLLGIGIKVEEHLLKNPYYQQCRSLLQILPIKALTVPLGFRREIFESYGRLKNMKDGDIKLPLILPLGLLEGFFNDSQFYHG